MIVLLKKIYLGGVTKPDFFIPYFYILQNDEIWNLKYEKQPEIASKIPFSAFYCHFLIWGHKGNIGGSTVLPYAANQALMVMIRKQEEKSRIYICSGFADEEKYWMTSFTLSNYGMSKSWTEAAQVQTVRSF